MLELSNISISYGKSKVINQISFQLEEDEILVILGRNGVGKTTLMKGIIRLLPTTQGKTSLNQKDVTKTKPYTRSRKGIAYVPQGREIIPQLTVQENLQLGALAHNIDYEKKSKEIFEYFPALIQHLKRKGGVLSGGQQQQLAIARALMGDPKILILDEPTEGIQPNIVMEISSILRRYHDEKKVPIIVVEQNLKFARKLGDRFLMIQKGSVVAEGEIGQLTDDLSKKYLSV